MLGVSRFMRECVCQCSTACRSNVQDAVSESRKRWRFLKQLETKRATIRVRWAWVSHVSILDKLLEGLVRLI